MLFKINGKKITDDITFTKDKLYNFLNNVELI